MRPWCLRTIVIVLVVLAAALLTPAQDPGPGPGPATCRLRIGADSVNAQFAVTQNASLECAGGRVVMAVKGYLGARLNSTGVSWDNRCAMAGCLLTVCSDTHVVIGDSLITQVPAVDASIHAALCIKDTAKVLLRNVDIVSNSGISAIVAAGRSRLDVHGSVFANNSGTIFAGGICAMGNASLTIENSFITDNARKPAAGLGPALTSAPMSAECIGVGLAVFDFASVVMGSSNIERNAGAGGCRGGGAAVYGSGKLTISGVSTIATNRLAPNHTSSPSDGGGVYVGGNAKLVVGGNSSILSNAADRGGGIFADGNATVRITEGALLANNNGSFAAASGSSIDARGNVSLFLTDTARVMHGGDGQISVFASDAASLSLTGAVRMDFVSAESTRRFNIFSDRNAKLSIAPGATSNGMPLTRCSSAVNMAGRPSIPCSVGEVSVHMREECQCCPAFSYTLEEGGDPESCQQCPSNAKCPGGNQIQPLPGFWHSSPNSVQVHKCPLFTVACGQGGVCQEGFTGNLCGACDVGAGSTGVSYGPTLPLRCVRCASLGRQLATYLLLFFGSVALISYTVHATWQDNRAGDTALRPSDLIKVLVQFLQYLVIFGSISVPWPDILTDMFAAAAMVFSVASGQSSLGCLLQYSQVTRPPPAIQRQLMLLVTAPLAVLVTVMLLTCLSHLAKRLWVAATAGSKARRGGGRGQAKPSLQLWSRLRVAVLVVLFYAYPTMVKVALSFFACLQIDDPSKLRSAEAPYALRGHASGYWVSDIQQECFAGWHRSWTWGLAVPATLILCVGVPGALLLFLWRNRAHAREAAFCERYGFLVRNFRDGRVWWEAVWAVQTVLLTAVSVFHFSMKAYYSLLLMGMIVLLSAALQQIYHPYVHQSLHRLHIMATCCLFVNIWLGLAFFAVEFDQSSLTHVHTAAGAFMVFMNSAFVTLCILRIMEQAHGPVLKSVAAAAAWVKQLCGLSSATAGNQSVGQQLPVQAVALVPVGSAGSNTHVEAA